jgi:hypothetical protein
MRGAGGHRPRPHRPEASFVRTAIATGLGASMARTIRMPASMTSAIVSRRGSPRADFVGQRAVGDGAARPMIEPCDDEQDEPAHDILVHEVVKACRSRPRFYLIAPVSFRNASVRVAKSLTKAG